MAQGIQYNSKEEWGHDGVIVDQKQDWNPIRQTPNPVALYPSLKGLEDSKNSHTFQLCWQQHISLS